MPPTVRPTRLRSGPWRCPFIVGEHWLSGHAAERLRGVGRRTDHGNPPTESPIAQHRMKGIHAGKGLWAVLSGPLPCATRGD